MEFDKCAIAIVQVYISKLSSETPIEQTHTFIDAKVLAEQKLFGSKFSMDDQTTHEEG